MGRGSMIITSTMDKVELRKFSRYLILVSQLKMLKIHPIEAQQIAYKAIYPEEKQETTGK